MATYTPMIQQYLKVKAEYQDAFLFFRLGDFYEMFFDDAVQASQLLEITLTSREGGTEDRIPMCGVPYHSAPQYIEQLITKGHKVAICEQTEDPKQAKGVVRREVVQLITPGTMMEGRGLSERENNYLASIASFKDGHYGFCMSDLTTGESMVTKTVSLDEVLNELATSGAREVVLGSKEAAEVVSRIRERGQVTISFEDDQEVHTTSERLVDDLADGQLVGTAARLLNYLFRTQKRTLDHLQPVKAYIVDQFMKIDYFSKRNLELTETIRSKGKKGSLLWLLDETKTAMGSRLLKTWVDRPLIDVNEIERRHSIVETLLNDYFARQEIREKLTEVYDLERLAGRIAFGNVNARDMLQLKRSLMQIPHLQLLVKQLPNESAHLLADQLMPCDAVTELLEKAIVDNPPLSVKEGNLLKDGFHEELDRYRDASRNGKRWIAELEKEEREKTGIKSLKVGYNRIFGYYIEITRANLHMLTEGQYERKQTLANAERFITPSLKEKETLILEAEEKSTELEYKLFSEIREQVKTYIPVVQKLAKLVSELDVLQCFAEVSEARHYVKPIFSQDRVLSIQNGRHPVVEKVMNAQEYVPNDCNLDDSCEMLLITGPNMSGKSTYMRQVALTSILAQMGCYVPADEAILPIFDQVFTRIGAADDLISGQSTFMVEMLEARNAIVHATRNSLVLFDEIGRGTSTYDGMALAQSIIEYIHNHIGAKTLFSTHYHELTVLERQLKQMRNVHVSAIEQNGKVVFLHKIKEGAADKSYGIHVAELAELPKVLIERANQILKELEAQSATTSSNTLVDLPTEVHEQAQLSLFDEPKREKDKKPSLSNKEKKVLDTLRTVEILEMTPMQAFNLLFELHKQAK